MDGVQNLHPIDHIYHFVGNKSQLHLPMAQWKSKVKRNREFITPRQTPISVVHFATFLLHDAMDPSLQATLDLCERFAMLSR
jgi:hypothetical protein